MQRTLAMKIRTTLVLSLALLGMGARYQQRLRKQQADGTPKRVSVDVHESIPLGGVVGFVCGRRHGVTMAP